MAINFSLWKKALRVIPNVSKEEWGTLDIVSRWLISTRAAVLVTTLISCLLAGLFALREGTFRPFAWLALTLGLVFSHGTNNLFNDYTDYARGVDKDNYFRTMYGPQPVAHGLMSSRQLLGYAAVTGAVALSLGVVLLGIDGWDPIVGLLLGIGVLFVVFYSWPLKYIAMGELAVLLVWGPLMVGGGFYVLALRWDWGVVLASAPYALGVTAVIFGKHIDKISMDRDKRIFTLPVLIGEKAARYALIALIVLSYLLVAALIASRYYTPIMVIVFVAIPTLVKVSPAFLRPKPAARPENFPEGQGGWPLFFTPMAFVHNRVFGAWFVLGLMGDVALRVFLPAFWR